MMDIEEKKRNRFTFLKKLHELSGGNERASFNMFAIGETLGFDRELTVSTINYLENMGLIKWRGSGEISIAPAGCLEIETALSHPDKHTTHFPAAADSIPRGATRDNQTRSDKPGAPEILVSTTARGQLREIIRMLNSAIGSLTLEPEKKRDLRAEMDTIEAQMTSSQPKITILALCLYAIQDILKGSADNPSAAELLVKLETLLGTDRKRGHPKTQS